MNSLFLQKTRTDWFLRSKSDTNRRFFFTYLDQKCQRGVQPELVKFKLEKHTVQFLLILKITPILSEISNDVCIYPACLQAAKILTMYTVGDTTEQDTLLLATEKVCAINSRKMFYFCIRKSFLYKIVCCLQTTR